MVVKYAFSAHVIHPSDIEEPDDLRLSLENSPPHITEAYVAQASLVEKEDGCIAVFLDQPVVLGSIRINEPWKLISASKIWVNVPRGSIIFKATGSVPLAVLIAVRLGMQPPFMRKDYRIDDFLNAPLPVVNPKGLKQFTRSLNAIYDIQIKQERSRKLVRELQLSLAHRVFSPVNPLATPV
jgi:hypothetical protein